MTSTPVSIRAIAPSDLESVTALLSERDGHALDRANVASALCNLDPSLLAGWIAFAGDEPAGLTTLYLRDQRLGDRTVRAGYWAHLFVRERFRKLMIYPQLVLAKMRGVRPLGIEAIFTGTRRAHVAEGHVKLGFAKVGELRVLFKPLRPFRLLARYKNWPGVAHAAAVPGDALYGAYLGARRLSTPGGTYLRDAVPDTLTLTQIAILLNEAGAGRSRQMWNADALRTRLAKTIDGADYRILSSDRGGRMVGALIYRMAVRERVRAGIVMELVGAPSNPDAAGALLARVEQIFGQEGADTTLFLDGTGAGDLLRTRGHRVSNETYQMLVWPKNLVPAGSAAADLSKWRFSFLDHDAF